jgi:hypothetical protein
VASLLKRARPSRRLLFRIAFWGSALAGSIALIFVPSQGLLASALFVAFAVLVLVRYRGAPAAALPFSLALAGVGLILGAIPYDPVRDVADGSVACAIIIVLGILFRDAAAGRRASALGRAGLRLRVAELGARLEFQLRGLLRRFDDVTWHRIWIGAAAVAVLAGFVVAAGASRGQEGWRLVGGPDGAAVWNASFLEASLQRDGSHLRDPAIVTADGSPPRVGIADSPLLTAAKIAVPGPWTGPEVANLLAILNLTALLVCAVLFVASLAGTTGGAALAVVAALALSPLLRQVGSTAPFDLWPALAIVTIAMRRPSPALAAAGAALGLLNVAGGYELGVLALGLGLAGRLTPRFAWAAGIAGVLGSLVGAVLSGVLSPDATTLSLWWSSNALARLARASGIAWSWSAAAVALAAVIAGWFWSLKQRDRGTRDAGIAAIVAGTLAIPALLGGVPLLVPARLLDVVPLGWPTARILALATILLVVPVAVAIRLALGRAEGVRAPLRALALVALVVAGLAAARPATPNVMVPAFPAHSDVVELPLAEPASRASFVFADDLLERGARISQSVPYVSVPALLPGDGNAELAIAMLRRRPAPAFVVVRLDVYADPAQRFAQPTVIDAADYAVPNLSDDPRASLASLTDQARVYQLVP